MNLPQLSTEEIKRYILYFWILSLTILCSVGIYIYAVASGVFGTLPSFRDLENPKSNIASQIFSEEGITLGSFYTENRSYTKYNELSPNIINALVATEDSRFKEHSGIDFSRTFSIIFYNLMGKRQGASTITQQLAKKLFGREKTNIIITKTKEWITAVKLERNYTKQEIIAMYLNTVDFGSNAYGIKTASKTFFNTTPDKLTLEQAALLVGMLKGPTYYSPVRYPERALQRRNTVLDRMAMENLISQNLLKEIKSKPIILEYKQESHNEGLAPYFREILRAEITKLINKDELPLKSDGTPYDLYRDGLKIYTTINSHMQKYAENAVTEHMTFLQQQFNEHWKGMNRDPISELSQESLQQSVQRSGRYKNLKATGASKEEITQELHTPIKMTVFSWNGNIDTVMSPMDSIKYYKRFLRTAMLSMDPHTGYVKAWVGGNDFRFFKYDQVATGSRQAGSTFKPFVYTAAIEQGFSPCLQVPDEPVVFEEFDDYTPKNADNSSGGYYTLREGLAQSKNQIAAYLMKELGPKLVVTYAKKMGLSADVPPYPSIVLGVVDVTLLEMTAAYCVFANKGILTKPIYLLRIEDKNGNPIYTHKVQMDQVISEETAYVMAHMLKGSTTLPNGTALRLRGSKYSFKMPIAAKTGTTQNQSDGWFMGVTPDLVTGVWTGCEDRSMHFESLRLGAGSNTALPEWALYMKQVYADPTLNISQEDFEPPANLNIELDCDKYPDLNIQIQDIYESPVEQQENKNRLGF